MKYLNKIIFSIYKSLVILEIWLAFVGAIYSRIAPFLLQPMKKCYKKHMTFKTV